MVGGLVVRFALLVVGLVSLGGHTAAVQALGAGAVQRGQAGGLQAWGDLGRRVVADLARTVYLAQVARQVGGLHVAHVVDEQLRLVATAFVDGPNPLADLLQVLRLRRNSDNRVGPLVGHELDHIGQRHAAVRAEQLLQLRHQFGHRGALQAVHADRHAFEPVDVEGVDGVLVVGQFLRGAGQADHIARRVHQQEGILTHERLQQLLHFAGTDVAQVEQPRSQAAWGLRHGDFWDQLTGHSLVGGQDHVAVALADHGVVGPGQQRFQN
ncbi:hypothetical protein D3C76_541460 [compost metagenome]